MKITFEDRAYPFAPWKPALGQVFHETYALDAETAAVEETEGRFTHDRDRDARPGPLRRRGRGQGRRGIGPRPGRPEVKKGRRARPVRGVRISRARSTGVLEALVGVDALVAVLVAEDDALYQRPVGLIVLAVDHAEGQGRDEPGGVGDVPMEPRLRRLAVL